jgi:cytochrome c nitrite reductase small subunit
VTWAWIPLVVAAQASVGPEGAEPGLRTIRVTVFCLSALAAALVAYHTVLRRHRPMDPATRWVLLIAFLVLSPLVYALNLGLAISDAKAVAFCDSCHVMKAYVEDLENPESEHLASLHYQSRWIAEHQCYTCHSDYGLFGGIEAKIAGVGHTWYNFVAGYELPLKIRGTYDNQRCLFCHGPVKGYREVSEHEKHAAAIASSAKSCVAGSCHVRPHPKAAAIAESAHGS